MKFIFNGNEVAADTSEQLRDLKIGNLSEIKIDLRDLSSIQFARDDYSKN